MDEKNIKKKEEESFMFLIWTVRVVFILCLNAIITLPIYSFIVFGDVIYMNRDVFTFQNTYEYLLYFNLALFIFFFNMLFTLDKYNKDDNDKKHKH